LFVTGSVALLAAAAACNKPRPEPLPREPDTTAHLAPSNPDAQARKDAPGPGPAPSPAAAQPAEEPAVDVGVQDVYDASEDVGQVPEEQAPADPLAEKLKRLKFKARRDAAWARAAVANIESYRADLKKFERDAAQWEVDRHIPSSPQLDTFKSTVYDLAGKNAIVIEYYEEQPDAAPRRVLPETLQGNREFEYEDLDVRDAHQVVLRVVPPDAASMRTWLGKVVETQRLVKIRNVGVGLGSLIVNFEVYSWRNVRPPLHKTDERTLEVELKQIGVEGSLEQLLEQDRVGQIQHAAMSYKEFNDAIPKLDEALALLDQGKLVAARLSYFRRTYEDAQRTNAQALQSKAIDTVEKKAK
jgi:hypothetical protein